MKRIIPFIIAIASACGGVFAFAPFNYWFLTYFSIIGLIWVAKYPLKKIALIASFLWGVVFFSVGVSWLHISINQFGGSSLAVSYLMVVALSCYLAIYPTIFAWVIQKFNLSSPALFATVWIITEWLRGIVFTGFPWLQFGYTQINSPFAGLAPILGVQGLNFFCTWLAGGMWLILQDLIRSKKLTKLILIQALIIMIVTLCVSFTSKLNFVKTSSEPATKFTLLQGNIPQKLKWSSQAQGEILSIYQNMIQQALEAGENQIIVLPEAALPLPDKYLGLYLDQLENLVKAKHSQLIIGGVHINSNNQVFNSIFVLGENSPSNRYLKHHLVPFGEYVPLANLLRQFGSIFNLPMSDFSAGNYQQPNLVAHGKKFAPAICYEIIFGKQLRKNTHPDTQYLLTISNDAWFGDSIGPWQHLQMAQMRALELGKPLIRATNNGITVFINAQGKILAQAPQFTRTSLSLAVPTTNGRTPYAIVGSLPLYIIMGLILFQHLCVALLKKAILTQTNQSQSKPEEQNG